MSSLNATTSALIDVLSIKTLLRLRVSYPSYAAASYIQNQKILRIEAKKGSGTDLR